jgi:hypothetical protein
MQTQGKDKIEAKIEARVSFTFCSGFTLGTPVFTAVAL